MDGVVLTSVPSVISGVCPNRVNAAGSRHHTPNQGSVLRTVNCVSSLSIHPSQKGSSFLRKRNCVATSRIVVKSAASSGKKVEPLLFLLRTEKQSLISGNCILHCVFAGVIYSNGV